MLEYLAKPIPSVIFQARKILETPKISKEELSDDIQMAKKLTADELIAQGIVWTGGNSLEKATCTNLKNALAPKTLSLELESIDSSLPHHGLTLGVLHEWFFVDPNYSDSGQQSHTGQWHAPLSVLSFIVGLLIAKRSEEDLSLENIAVSWIGRSCWPSPTAIEERIIRRQISANSKKPHNTKQLPHFIFIDPINKAKKLWSIVQAIRSPASLAVVADGSGLNITQTRQLQVAAKDTSTLILIARPPWEKERPSVSQTKWLVSPSKQRPQASSSQSMELEWSIELIRSRGLASTKKWLVVSEQENLKEITLDKIQDENQSHKNSA